MLQVLVGEMEAAGVQPAYTQRLSPGGHPRGDPSDSTSSAVAQGVGAAVSMEEMEAAGVQRPYTQPLSQEGHPRGDPSDSTSSAVAEEVGAAVLMEEMEAAGVQRPYTQRLSPEGHPRGDPSDSTSCAVAQEGGSAVLMARDPSGDEFVTPTSSSLAQGRGPPAGAHRVDSPSEVLSPPAPPPPQVVRTTPRHVLDVEHRPPGPRSAPPMTHLPLHP